MESNCSDTNWYWHPDEQKCARGLGALGISFSELPDCCKQAFGDNACDWHDECNHVPSSEQPVDVVEASDAPVEVEQTFFEAYHHGGNSNSVRVSTKAAKSSPSKSSKTGYITKMETAGIHVRMKGKHSTCLFLLLFEYNDLLNSCMISQEMVIAQVIVQL